jgi:sulfhydrogenase subunit beta (sulfur reductase)
MPQMIIMFTVLLRKDVPKFVDSLIKEFKVYGPVRSDKDHIFKELENGKEVDIDYRTTILPPTDLILPQKEVLFEFDKKTKKMSFPDGNEKRVIFGIHPCDLNALQILDLIFESEENYRKRKENTILICLECKDYGEYCTCYVHGFDEPKGYDILLLPAKGKFLVVTGSEKGRKIVEKNKVLKKVKKKPKVYLKGKKGQRINLEKLKKAMKRNYLHKAWQQLADKCLSCGNCTVVCPTCYCFDIQDRMDFSDKIQRIRELNSCHQKSFTRIAGDVVFRDKRVDRVKQWIYHKYYYFVLEFNKIACTGCGRCVKYCPTDLDRLVPVRKVLRSVK